MADEKEIRFREISEPVNGMCPVSTAMASIEGYVVIAKRGDEWFIYEQLFHRKDLAKREAKRQKVLFDEVMVDNVRAGCECSNGEIDLYCPDFEELDDEARQYAESRRISRRPRDRSEPVNGMLNVSTGQGVLGGWVLIAWRCDGVSIHERIFSCREFAEQEAMRQRPGYDRFSVEPISIEAEAGNEESDFNIDLFDSSISLRGKSLQSTGER